MSVGSVLVVGRGGCAAVAPFAFPAALGAIACVSTRRRFKQESVAVGCTALEVAVGEVVAGVTSADAELLLSLAGKVVACDSMSVAV